MSEDKKPWQHAIEATMYKWMFICTTVSWLGLALMCWAKDHRIAEFQRDALSHGHAYYTNSPSGEPIFTWREAK